MSLWLRQARGETAAFTPIAAKNMLLSFTVNSVVNG